MQLVKSLLSLVEAAETALDLALLRRARTILGADAVPSRVLHIILNEANPLARELLGAFQHLVPSGRLFRLSRASPCLLSARQSSSNAAIRVLALWAALPPSRTAQQNHYERSTA